MHSELNIHTVTRYPWSGKVTCMCTCFKKRELTVQAYDCAHHFGVRQNQRDDFLSTLRLGGGSQDKCNRPDMNVYKTVRYSSPDPQTRERCTVGMAPNDIGPSPDCTRYRMIVECSQKVALLCLKSVNDARYSGLPRMVESI
jgi:hypothetical protein